MLDVMTIFLSPKRPGSRGKSRKKGPLNYIHALYYYHAIKTGDQTIFRKIAGYKSYQIRSKRKRKRLLSKFYYMQ